MIVLIKGAGDLATGVAQRVKAAGFDVIMTEIKKPTTVRRTVAFSQAVYDKVVEVEGVKAMLAEDFSEIKQLISNDIVPILIDEKCRVSDYICPDVVVDAIIAKKNIGTTISQAKIVIALGPGFEAGVDCHAVIETKRGHYLGKVIYEGFAIANTGVPGNIGGHSEDRIIRAEYNGEFISILKIGDYVKEGQVIGYIDNRPIYSLISGVLRGILADNILVTKGMKCGDIDPRGVVEHCFSISDKARSVGGGVLEAILHLNMLASKKGRV